MKKQKKPRPIRKRPFLLLEILISLLLVSLCLFPLLAPHIQMRKADYHFLEKMRFTTLSQNAFCLLKIKLHELQIDWKSLQKGVYRELEGVSEEELCFFELKQLDECTKKNKGSLLVLKADFFFKKNAKVWGPFSYTLCVEKKNS